MELFTLPKSRLYVFDEELQRRNEDGTLLLRLPLASIHKVEFRRPLNPFCLVFVGTGLVCVGIAWFVSANNLLSCLLYVAALVLLVLAIGGMRHDQIVVWTETDAIVLDCAEQSDEVKCFVASFQSVLAGKGK